ncbi:hypothetical protein RJ641_013613 [Dillenia turbinata]|uniref:Ribosome biogenesis protein SLX9 n=1 Tax=Dillenia turbinata TaxID=194707 RepID=A0AAN8WAC8_9MAGN
MTSLTTGKLRSPKEKAIGERTTTRARIFSLAGTEIVSGEFGFPQVRDTLSTLSAKKAINKFLPELKAPPQPTTEEANLKLNPKSRGKLIEKESRRLKIVLNHAAFQSDPLATIHRHLQSTQPVVEEKPKNKSSKNAKKKKRQEENGSYTNV